ncbi:PQQ-dependent sugar dehydrogenase [bacterium]|nr:PQQ-dependent sugar dehydrogenase [bacterium]
MNASRLFIAAVAAFAAAWASAQMPLTTITVASGLARPVYVTAAPGDTNRLFIVEQRSGATGFIRIFNIANNQMQPAPFAAIGPVSTGGEQGLLGLAFHPGYATNGFFYVNLTDASGTTRIRRYQVSANPDIADTNTLHPILSLNQPFVNHNAGWVGFGRDGYLHIPTGDGGSAFDPSNNAQNTSVLLGKILRIDVDGDDFPGDPARNYAVPTNNPFYAGGGAGELWAYGLRNPWRCSFDRLTGDLWIGDVGQAQREEVDFQPAASTGGENYGWRCIEGTLPTGLCTNPPPSVPPVHEYTHGDGFSITGGNVYRGNAIPDLTGTYFFADYGSTQIWSFRYTGVVTDFTNRSSELQAGGGGIVRTIVSFGEDAEGEIYICSLGGAVHKIVPVPEAAVVPPAAAMLALAVRRGNSLFRRNMV